MGRSRDNAFLHPPAPDLDPAPDPLSWRSGRLRSRARYDQEQEVEISCSRIRASYRFAQSRMCPAGCVGTICCLFLFHGEHNPGRRAMGRRRQRQNHRRPHREGRHRRPHPGRQQRRPHRHPSRHEIRPAPDSVRHPAARKSVRDRQRRGDRSQSRSSARSRACASSGSRSARIC